MKDKKEIKLIIPHAELLNYGCKNCIWRLHNQCPHAILEDDVFSFIEGKDTIIGYCPEFADFILSFAEGADSISAVWEKFAIYQAKLQSLVDYKTYLEAETRLREMEKDKKADPIKLERLDSCRDRLRIFWMRMNENVIRSLSKVVDREQSQNENSKRPIAYIHAKEINFTQPKQVENAKLHNNP